MTSKKKYMVALGALIALLAAGAWMTTGDSEVPSAKCAIDTGDRPAATVRETGPVRLGRFLGEVTRKDPEDVFFLEMRGTRFPFKASPLQAMAVKLEAPGKNVLQQNTSLLYTILGKEVGHVTLLIDPAEEEDVMPAARDLARYIQITNANKFAGVAYTAPGGKMKRSVAMGKQAQALEDATAHAPILLLKGPRSGAKTTQVTVKSNGRVIVEGETYEDLYRTADFICVTLLKMLCGSPECPNAAACATGGDCGCG